MEAGMKYAEGRQEADRRWQEIGMRQAGANRGRQGAGKRQTGLQA